MILGLIAVGLHLPALAPCRPLIRAGRQHLPADLLHPHLPRHHHQGRRHTSPCSNEVIALAFYVVRDHAAGHARVPPEAGLRCANEPSACCALIRKETIQLLRDRRTLVIILVLPLDRAVPLRLRHPPDVATTCPPSVADMSMDAQSRALSDGAGAVRTISTSLGVSPARPRSSRAIDEGRAKVGVVIPPDFAGAHRTRRGPGADHPGWVRFVLGQLGLQRGRVLWPRPALWPLAQDTGPACMGIDLQTTPIVTSTTGALQPGPERPDLHHAGPGGHAAADSWRCITTAQSVVREYELGTIEQLLATPARPLEMRGRQAGAQPGAHAGQSGA